MIIPDWIEHDDSGCPFDVGETVTHRHRDGMVCVDTIEDADMRPGCWHQGPFICISAWFWATNGRPEFLKEADIVAYQVSHERAEDRYAERVTEPA